MRRNISWRMKREDGTSCEVRVSFFGGKYQFQFKESIADEWDYKRSPSPQDLEALVDAVRRRYQRRQASEREVEIAERLLKGL